MTGDGRDPRIDFRLPPSLLDWVDDQADTADMTRSDVVRRSLHFTREARGDALEREAEIRDDIRDIIEQNQELRQVVPSKWRNHVQGLFVDDLRDNTSPEDMRALAAGYRRQAEKMEELAATIPHAPEGDLVGIVDEELRNALEAADLSNWYDDVDNPHEKHLSGVREGREEREGLVRVVQSVVETYSALAAAFEDHGKVPAVKTTDLPDYADSILPDDVEKEDVAHLATELVRAGVTAEQVPDVVPTVDPSLDVQDIESVVDGDQGDVEPAAIRVGGDVREPGEQDDDETANPLPVSASETTQRQLMQSVAAADGGRHPESVPPKEVDTDMNETNDSDDSGIDYDNPEEASDVLDDLAAGEPAREGQSDD